MISSVRSNNLKNIGQESVSRLTSYTFCGLVGTAVIPLSLYSYHKIKFHS